MIKIFQRLRHRQPKYIKNVWYNKSIHMHDEKFPIVFGDDKKYIHPAKGVKIVMNELPGGKLVYYEIIKIRMSRGGDWLYSTDAIDCDLKFSHIS